MWACLGRLCLDNVSLVSRDQLAMFYPTFKYVEARLLPALRKKVRNSRPPPPLFLVRSNSADLVEISIFFFGVPALALMRCSELWPGGVGGYCITCWPHGLGGVHHRPYGNE